MSPFAGHRAFLAASQRLAEASVEHGNHPFGAVLVLDERIVLEAENDVVTTKDCTAHAELNLVRRASAALTPAERRRATLYASTEPCAMCAGAIYWSGIRSVVFACSVHDMASHTTGSFVVACRDVFAQGAEPTAVVGPLFGDDALALHARFWRRRRE